jgi:hypothetical protein
MRLKRGQRDRILASPGSGRAFFIFRPRRQRIATELAAPNQCTKGAVMNDAPNDLPPSGWWTGRAVLPVLPPENHAIVVRRYVDAHPDEARRMGLDAGMNLDALRAGAIRAGWVRFRLHTDRRKWNPKTRAIIANTDSFNARSLDLARVWARRLIEMGAVDPAMTAVVGDAEERLLYRGPAEELVRGNHSIGIKKGE